MVISRNGEVVIHDENNRERERHKVPYGATLLARDGETVKAGQVLATVGSAYAARSSPEYAGRVRFENVEEGVTVAQADRRGHRPLDAGRRRSRSAAAASRPRACARR